MGTVEPEEDLAEAVFEKLRLHCRRKASGLVRMIQNGELDIFDGLAVAPLVLAEEIRLAEMAGYERRRLAWLGRYQAGDCDDDSQRDATTHPRKGAR